MMIIIIIINNNNNKGNNNELHLYNTFQKVPPNAKSNLWPMRQNTGNSIKTTKKTQCHNVGFHMNAKSILIKKHSVEMSPEKCFKVACLTSNLRKFTQM